MAYTDIPDANLEPGKPIRSIDALALRDNPIAIANGDNGAPRIKRAALENSIIAEPQLLNGAVSAGKLNGPSIQAWLGGLGTNQIGTYGLMSFPGSNEVNPGDIVAGSSIGYADAAGNIKTSSASGSWKCRGYKPSGSAGVTLFQRIS